MIRALNTLLPVVALCVTTSAYAQSGVLDQSETHDNVIWGMQYFNDMQQDIIVGIDGTLAGFEIQMLTTDVNEGLPVAIWTGTGPHLTPPIWTGTVYASQPFVREWVYADCSSAGLQLLAGDIFTIRVGDGVTFSSVPIDLVGNSGWPNPYYAGFFWIDFGYRNTDRLTFKTYMEVNPSVLTVSGTCGGSMTFDVINGSGSYWLVTGNAGSSSPGGIDLAIANPTPRTPMGTSIILNVPAAACGLTVQAVDVAYRLASNPVVL